LPIFEKPDDVTDSEPLAWLGIDYKERISNRLKPDDKEKEYLIFADRSQSDFDRRNVSRFVYLDRIGNSDERDGFIEAIKRNPVYKPCQIVFIPVNEPFEARNGDKLFWTGISLLTGLVIWLIMILTPKTNKRQLLRIKAGKPDKEAQQEMKEFIDFLKPKKGYFITPVLIYVNLFIYFLMVIMGLGFVSFNANDLLLWGANYAPQTTTGEWWRLLTSLFLHGGAMHIFANMYGLLFVGIFLEPLLGEIKFLSVYLLTGIVAGMASIGWYDATVSVGASGAIFGLYGVFISLLLTKVYPPDFSKMFLISILMFVGFNLLMGLTGGIDNAAHIGGLLSGLITGFILSPSLKRRMEKEK
jgi:membrane associated rhomboid family serine protease